MPASASHPIGCHVEVIYRSRELTFGKINPPTFDVIVGVVSLGQRCFQDFAAEDFVDQQRRDVALAAPDCPLVFRDQQHDNMAAMRSLSNYMTDPLQWNAPRAGRMQTAGDH